MAFLNEAITASGYTNLIQLMFQRIHHSHKMMCCITLSSFSCREKAHWQWSEKSLGYLHCSEQLLLPWNCMAGPHLPQGLYHSFLMMYARVGQLLPELKGCVFYRAKDALHWKSEGGREREREKGKAAEREKKGEGTRMPYQLFQP